MDKLTDDDLEIIRNAPSLLLAKCYCILNSWGWPEGFKDPITKEDRTVNNRGWQIMMVIQQKVGMKMTLMVWNTNYPGREKQNMTRAEFETWWKLNYDVTTD